ncbi:MAG TPA: beta-ketoacyl synthase N-terminal-like domain-containing protein, partial [Euzebya sp.]|nr:beta-ketoacyl synthase N-terminal-like domain-containing protein [Euzebya sp.]
MTNEARRVLITGVGVVSALGIGTEQTWKAMLGGQTGIGPITLYDPSTLHTRIAAEIPAFDPTAFAKRRALRMTTRNDQL